MRERGRASIITIAGTAAVLLVAAMFFFSKESPADAGGRFMDALARADAKALAENSYMENDSKDQIQAKWQKTIDTAGRYYQFAWMITSHKELDDNRAAVIMRVIKDVSRPEAYDQKYELPMVKKEGKWLVDVRRLPRDMYPGMPR